jgi:prepilin-type N-terminal cleavage/methylation domain-containing protein
VEKIPMNVQQKTKGFTIIEVVLVLAIAGLIFLMVFIALPALQRSQRDSSRKSEVGTIVSAISSYQSANRGGQPTAIQIAGYINSSTDAKLDSGATVIVAATAYGSAITATPSLDTATSTIGSLNTDEIKVYFGYKCASNTSLVKGLVKQAAVAAALESGPKAGTAYCQNT